MVDQEVRHYAKVLEACVRIKGLTSREVDRRTGQGEGTFKRIFNGVIDLKVRHILLVLRAIGLSEGQFFQLVRTTRGNAAGGAGIFDALLQLGVAQKEEPMQQQKIEVPIPEELEHRIDAMVNRAIKQREEAKLKGGASGNAEKAEAGPASGISEPQGEPT